MQRPAPLSMCRGSDRQPLRRFPFYINHSQWMIECRLERAIGLAAELQTVRPHNGNRPACSTAGDSQRERSFAASQTSFMTCRAGAVVVQGWAPWPNCMQWPPPTLGCQQVHQTAVTLPGAIFGFFHDMSVTDNYYVLVENPLRLNLMKLLTRYMLGRACIAECLGLDPAKPMKVPARFPYRLCVLCVRWALCTLCVLPTL